MMRSSSIGLFSSALLTLVLCSCGGGGSGGDAGGGGGDGGGGSSADTTAPTAVLSQTAALTANEHLVIRFSEAMNPASLHLNGTLTTDSIGSVWSKTNVENDTLTLSSKIDGWSSGSGRTLMVDGKDLAGNALATLTATYAVKLGFDNFQNAAVAIGQADFAAGAVNQGGGAGANTLAGPHGNPAISAGGRLFVGDYFNHRVLAYNQVPDSNNADADFVLGQSDFFTTISATNQATHNRAEQVATEDGKLVVADSGSNRVVIYNTVPANGAAVASVVVGQPDFISTGPAACTDSSMYSPEAVATTPDGKLIVTDSGHNRVLIWNSMPAAWGQPADVVVGQFDFVHCTQNDDDHNGGVDIAPSARTLNYPNGVWTDGTRLVISDNGNNRVLIWNQIPTSNFQPANVVLGQFDFTGRTANDDDHNSASEAVPTARTLNTPAIGIGSNGVQLAIADTLNHRVLIWNTFPTTNFQAADVVLGQGDFNHSVLNDDNQNGSLTGPSARTMAFPSGVLFYRDKLLVADNANNRVLIFKSK